MKHLRTLGSILKHIRRIYEIILIEYRRGQDDSFRKSMAYGGISDHGSSQILDKKKQGIPNNYLTLYDF